jgi:hypothetical protein
VLRDDEKLKKDRLGMDFNMNTPMGFLGKRKLQEFGAKLNKRADEMMLHVCAHAIVSMKTGMKMSSLIRVVRNFMDGS